VPCAGDIEKAAPVTLAVPVTDEFPIFVNVTDKLEVVFRVTLPKDKLEGVAEIVVARGYKFKEKVCGELIPA
jgi:hypothetical protein